MGKDTNPQINLQHSPWWFSNINSANNIHQQFDTSPQNNNSLVFPTFVNPYGCIFSVNAATHLPDINTNKFLSKASPLIPPLIPSHKSPELDGSEKGYLVFDQLNNGRSFIFSSSVAPSSCFNSMNPGFGLQGSTETIVSNCHGAEEMHEDTEEINALLYSDSDDEHDDEEGCTGHSPLGEMEKSSSEVASSMHPTKKRRIDADNEFDASLVDTASSQVFPCPGVPTDHRNKEDDDAESSCVKGGYHNQNEDDRRLKRDAESSCKKGGCDNQNEDDRLLKRARIRETLGLLRRIVPGGKRKDTATVLDEAICYLKLLKLKAKSLNVYP